jgi:hypothetical protein
MIFVAPVCAACQKISKENTSIGKMHTSGELATLTAGCSLQLVNLRHNELYVVSLKLSVYQKLDLIELMVDYKFLCELDYMMARVRHRLQIV